MCADWYRTREPLASEAETAEAVKIADLKCSESDPLLAAALRPWRAVVKLVWVATRPEQT